ncbi:hypothetical protein P154DRAFT_524822 [Amniculicola lignicola CBS 123094]|uniref:Uncharacterized protein n=1 Tax=Amniculicola lignicola CBS 123094 TaxID=1392246 RepID=A0A6A5W6G9_9PLEO|nr:hypothetical protein P154DRAFT_524822 [Amniculicola lignicola CBS 123094]
MQISAEARRGLEGEKRVCDGEEEEGRDKGNKKAGWATGWEEVARAPERDRDPNINTTRQPEAFSFLAEGSFVWGTLNVKGAWGISPASHFIT